MTTAEFVVTQARDARFERGLRLFFEYRHLGMEEATGGRVAAHVIRAAAGTAFSSQPHLHRTTFQLVYVLKGWIEFEYEGWESGRQKAGPALGLQGGEGKARRAAWARRPGKRRNAACAPLQTQPGGPRRFAVPGGVARSLCGPATRLARA